MESFSAAKEDKGKKGDGDDMSLGGVRRKSGASREVPAWKLAMQQADAPGE